MSEVSEGCILTFDCWKSTDTDVPYAWRITSVGQDTLRAKGMGMKSTFNIDMIKIGLERGDLTVHESPSPHVAEQAINEVTER